MSTAMASRWSMTAVVLGLITACGGEPPPPAPPFEATASTAFLMAHLVEPAADKIWDSAGSIITADGEEDLAPVNDDEWAAVLHSATVVAESGNLLMLEGRARDNDDWMEISRGLVDTGRRVMAAAEAKDADALFDVGADLYNVCVACHQIYWIENNRVMTDTR